MMNFDSNSAAPANDLFQSLGTNKKKGKPGAKQFGAPTDASDSFNSMLPRVMQPLAQQQYGQAHGQPQPSGYGGQQAGQQAGMASITTSVTPAPVYSPEQTIWAQNQAMANAAQQADPRWAQKQFIQPGRSLDAGTMAAAVPKMAAAMSEGMQSAALQPILDAFANQQQLQQGQVAQQAEANALMNALAQFNENAIYQRQQTQLPLLSILGGALSSSNQLLGF